MEEIDSSTPKKTLTQMLAWQVLKYIKGASKYTNVGVYEFEGVHYFRAAIARFSWINFYETEREAAIAVDRKLLEKGEQPINILVRVKK